MKIKSHGIDDIVFIPESRQEAELMQRWDAARECKMSLTDSTNWGHIELTLHFDSEKGRKRIEKINKDLGIYPVPMNP